MKLGDFFEVKSRDNGEAFVSLKEGSPGWLRDAVYSAHIDTMPNDWIYAECSAAADAIDEGYLTADNVNEFANDRVDVYSAELFQWAANMHATSLFSEAESRANDCGAIVETDVVSVLSRVQYFALELVAELFLEGVKGHTSEEKEDEPPHRVGRQPAVGQDVVEGGVGMRGTP